MSQTHFALSPDRLIMVQATIHALDDSKHVTIDLILDTGASFTTINPDILSDLGYDLSDPNLHKIDFITASGTTKAAIIAVSKLSVFRCFFAFMCYNWWWKITSLDAVLCCSVKYIRKLNYDLR